MVGADVGEFAVFEDEDLVRLHQRRNPVGDEDDGGAAHPLFEGRPDFRVGLGVDRREGVVEDHDGRLLHQHPGNRDPLFLAAREGDPPFADDGVIAVREGVDGVVDAGDGGRLADARKPGIRMGNRDVFSDRAGEEVGFLQNQADILPEVVLPDFPDIDPADGDRTFPGAQIIEPVEEGGDGALAGAGAAEDREGLPGGDGEAEVREDRL